MYPCDCEEMQWMMDTNNVFRYESEMWVLTWVELDKTNKGTNIERFGIKFNYCIFCGKRIGEN